MSPFCPVYEWSEELLGFWKGIMVLWILWSTASHIPVLLNNKTQYYTFLLSSAKHLLRLTLVDHSSLSFMTPAMSMGFDSPWEFKNISVSFSLIFKPTSKYSFFFLIQTNKLFENSYWQIWRRIYLERITTIYMQSEMSV